MKKRFIIKKWINGICLIVILVMLPRCVLKTTKLETSDGKTANTVLDYAQGIADGVYGWTLSEDGRYYMLSAIDENGTPIESTAQQNFKGGGKDGMKGGGNSGKGMEK